MNFCLSSKNASQQTRQWYLIIWFWDNEVYMWACVCSRYDKNLLPKELSQITKKKTTQFLKNGQRNLTDTWQKQKIQMAGKYEKMFSIISQ